MRIVKLSTTNAPAMAAPSVGGNAGHLSGVSVPAPTNVPAPSQGLPGVSVPSMSKAKIGPDNPKEDAISRQFVARLRQVVQNRAKEGPESQKIISLMSNPEMWKTVFDIVDDIGRDAMLTKMTRQIGMIPR